MASNVDSGRGIAESGYFGGILTQKTNLSPFSLNLILFVLATYLRQVAVFTDHYERKGDPDEDQRYVQDEEGLGG